MSDLAGAVRALLDGVLADLLVVGDAAGHRDLAAEREALDRPLRLALAGRIKVGKSTLLNALVGEPLAPTDDGECTRVVTHYRHGPRYRAEGRRRDGTTVELTIRRGPHAAEVDLGGIAPEQLDRLVVEWPSPRLQSMTLVDTPGLDSAAAPAAPMLQEVDAVVYLLRHLHTADRAFLEAFRDPSLAPTAAINAVGVLARADEVGGGGLDAMVAATTAAELLMADGAMRGRCGEVVAVAGLVAQGAATLRERDFEAVARLAMRPREDVDRILRTAERLAAAEPELMERLGLFGTRVAVALVRLGDAADASALADRLAARSGITVLRALIDDRFLARAGVLKAHHALLRVRDVLASAPLGPALDGWRVEAERITAGAHELAELHLLLELRSSNVLPTADLPGVERLLGAFGPGATTRLGLAPDASPSAIESTARAEIERWRRAAVHPLSSPAFAHAAEVLARTAEGLLDAPAGF